MADPRLDNTSLDVQVSCRVNERLSLDVRFTLDTECGVIFGRSGAGKTTLLRLIAGLIRPDSGRVRLGERVLFDSQARVNLPLHERGVGVIYQDDLLFPHLDVRRNILFGLKGWPAARARQRFDEVVALCQVGQLINQRASQLSGGERQRVGLARALAPRPRLLLCDEPVSALDLAARFSLLERLRAVQRSERIPVLYVTHSPAEAQVVADRAFLLNGGRIAAEGDVLDVVSGSMQAPGPWPEPLRNLLHGIVLDDGRIQLDGEGSPIVATAANGTRVGERVTICVRADDILLAVPSGQMGALRFSARNQIGSVVERVVAQREVVVITGTTRWVVSVTPAAVDELSLEPGSHVHMIVKARSVALLGAVGAAPSADPRSS